MATPPSVGRRRRRLVLLLRVLLATAAAATALVNTTGLRSIQESLHFVALKLSLRFYLTLGCPVLHLSLLGKIFLRNFRGLLVAQRLTFRSIVFS